MGVSKDVKDVPIAECRAVEIRRAIRTDKIHVCPRISPTQVFVIAEEPKRAHEERCLHLTHQISQAATVNDLDV
jgi:hypothetical protein